MPRSVSAPASRLAGARGGGWKNGPPAVESPHVPHPPPDPRRHPGVLGPVARDPTCPTRVPARPAAPGGHRVAFLIYRGNPRCGGQGVYTRHLTRELVALGHSVEVFSGPPWPELDEGVGFTPVRGLDLYRDPDPFRIPAPAEFTSLADVAEFAVMLAGGFGEPRGLLPADPQAARGAPGRLRHRPRQPVPGLGDRRAGARRVAAARDAAPPHHRRPLDRARPRRRPSGSATPRGAGSASCACRCASRGACRPS